jgi:hypothetical protein
MEIDLWYQEDDDSIHITSRDDPRFHSTMKNDAGSTRRHGSLFRHFQRVLAEQGRWPESPTAEVPSP